MKYGIVVLRRMGPNPEGPGWITDELSREVDTLDDAVEAVEDVLVNEPAFMAITIVHIEDMPLIMKGARLKDAEG